MRFSVGNFIRAAAIKTGRVKVGLMVACAVILVSGCTTYRGFDSYDPNGTAKPYDRKTEPYTPVVDSHTHFRPFGGEEVPFDELMEYFEDTGVLFVSAFGIGQLLPIDSTHTYYADTTEAVKPTIKSDFLNAHYFLRNKPKNVHVTLSMSFPDLEKPEEIVDLIKLYDREYPGVFTMMGEVNVVKQALFGNKVGPVGVEKIAQWKDFMAVLRKRNMPLNIHADLGDDKEPLKYLYLVDEMLRLYPDNKIVWSHMGLSKELKTMDPAEHIALMKRMLNKNPNLMVDLSWRVLEDNYLKKYRKEYVAFINAYSERILPGTDFVASRNKTFDIYREELEVVSRINKHLSDEAFRNIVLGNNYFKLLGLDYRAPEILKN